MVTRWITTAVVAGLLASCSGQTGSGSGDSVGSYVTSDNDAAIMVQIASLHDGQVSGTISLVGAQADGKNVAGTRPFTGTIEGKALNLSIENGTGVSLATGTLEGSTLRLTLFANGNSTQLMLAKSDAEKFDQLANATRVRAAEKKQDIESVAASKDRTQRRSETQRSINQLADREFAKAGELLEKSRRIDVLIAGYRAARDRTAKMQSTKHSINANSSEGSYRISQIDYQIDGLANDMENTHTSVQNYMTDLISFANDATLQSSQRLAECQTDRLLDCSRLSAGMQLFQSRYQQFRRDYQRENAAFTGKSGASA